MLNDIAIDLIKKASLNELENGLFVDTIFVKANIAPRHYIDFKDKVKIYATKLRKAQASGVSVEIIETHLKTPEKQQPRIIHKTALDKPKNDLSNLEKIDNDSAYDHDFENNKEVLDSAYRETYSYNEKSFRSQKTSSMTTWELIQSDINKYPSMKDHRKHFGEYQHYVSTNNKVMAELKLDEIYRHNQKLIILCMNKNPYLSNCPREDLFQIGSIALIKAIKEYDPDNSKFSTFATRCITNELKKMAIKDLYLVKHGPSRMTIHRKLKVVQSMLFNSLGRDPSYEEIALQYKEVMGDFITANKVEAIFETIQSEGSLEVKVDDDEVASLLDLIENDNSPNPLQEVLRQELLDKLMNAMDSLSYRDDLVLKLRFGFNEEKRCYKHQEIADELGVTKERIRQIESEALSKLSHYGHSKTFINYMNSDYDLY